jgi:hypothetical protein
VRCTWTPRQRITSCGKLPVSLCVVGIALKRPLLPSLFWRSSKHSFQETGILNQINRLRFEGEDTTPPAATSVMAEPSSGAVDNVSAESKARDADPTSVAEQASGLAVNISRSEDGVTKVGGSSRSPSAKTSPHSRSSTTAASAKETLGTAASTRSEATSALQSPLRSSRGTSAPATFDSRRDGSSPGDPLNISGFTASSANSPFYSPVAHYQYPSYSPGDMQGNTAVAYGTRSGGPENYVAHMGTGIRAHTPTCDAQLIGASPEEATSTDTGTHMYGRATGYSAGRVSAAEARARVLSGLLFSNTSSPGSKTSGGVGAAGSTVVPTSTLTRVNSRNALNALAALKAASPPVAVNGVGQLKSSNTTAAKLVPVLSPIKKVTSHSSISSSLGSNSFLAAQYFSHNATARSRSHSKVDEHDYAFDIRALLADSPSVAPAPLIPSSAYAPGHQYLYGSASSDACPSPLTANNSANTSNCNSRARSRGSSFNASYVQSGAYAHTINESALMSRLHAGSTSAVVSALRDGGTPQQGTTSAAGSVKVRVSPAHNSAPSSTEHSPSSAHKQSQSKDSSRGHHDPGAVWTGQAEVSASATLPQCLPEERGYDYPSQYPPAPNDCSSTRSASPAPSFASSLSSYDSVPRELRGLVETGSEAAAALSAEDSDKLALQYCE